MNDLEKGMEEALKVYKYAIIEKRNNNWYKHNKYQIKERAIQALNDINKLDRYWYSAKNGLTNSERRQLIKDGDYYFKVKVEHKIVPYFKGYHYYV